MLKYASGRYEICLPNITVQTGTASSAPGTYYIWAQARNDIGYNLPVGPFQITLGVNQGISLTWSSDCYRNGEVWRRFALTVATTNNPENAEIFCEVDVSSTTLASASSIVEPYFLANPSPLASSVPDAYVDGSGNAAYGRGVIFQYSDGNFYRYNKQSNVTYPATLASSKGGQWVQSYYISRSIYIEDTSDPNLGCDVLISDILDTKMILPLTYSANGALGPSRYFGLYNSGSTSFSGIVFNIKVELLGEDVSTNFKGLLKIKKPFVTNKTTGYTVSTSNTVSDYDVSQAITFTAPQAYQEAVFQVQPQFSYTDLAGLPVGSFSSADLSFTPFLSRTPTQYSSEILSLLGNKLVMPVDGRIRVHPTTSGVKVTSGKYSFSNTFYTVSETNLTDSTTGLRTVSLSSSSPLISTAISGGVRATYFRGNANSRLSSFSTGVLAGSSPILNISLTHPLNYRYSLPDILAGSPWLGNFIVSSSTLYVKRTTVNDVSSIGTIYKFDIAGVIYNYGDSPIQTTSIDLSNPTSTYATNTYESAPYFPEAGLYSPRVPSVTVPISGTGYYYFVACQYNWVSQVTQITHNIDYKEVFVSEPGVTYEPFEEPVNGYYSYTTLPSYLPPDQFKTKVVVNPKGYPEFWTYVGESFPSSPYVDKLASNKWYRIGSELGFFSEGSPLPSNVTPSFDRELYYNLEREELFYNSQKATKDWKPVFNLSNILTYNGEVLVDNDGDILSA